MISKIKTIFLLIFAFVISGCTGFLDLVPDSQLTLDMIFIMKEDAWNGLAKVYSYMPQDQDCGNTTWLLGDEYMTCAQENKDDWWAPMQIMRGRQSATDPRLGYWQGSGGAPHLYKGIRSANIFLNKINEVTDMSPVEIADWKAQVKFLKAYYHFILLRSYGPIIISDHEVSSNATGVEVYPYRSKVEDCFQYIIKLMDEAIPDLREMTPTTEAGQVNKYIAKAIKARVLLYRASPFYSGNRDYYEDFLDFDGKPYFSVYDTPQDTKQKWKEALDATNDAIESCLKNGKELYHFDKAVYPYDRHDMDTNMVKMKTLYDLRFVVVEPWNRELVWGLANTSGNISNYSNIMLPDRFMPGNTDLAMNPSYSDQQLGATYHMLEVYYTQNGLPITEDLTFKYATRHNFVLTPGGEEPEYQEMRGYMQPGAITISLYMNREPRFYANLGITGGYWRSHEQRIETDFLPDSYDGGGGFVSARENNYIWTGIGVQKLVHPESKSGHPLRLVKFPFPIIRLADLYLMKAEAMNEYLDAPTQEVYNAVNLIRQRAGIPNLEDAWSNPSIARNVNKQRTKEGMREIIKQERACELAFEGARFWDLLRWKEAVGALSAPAIGWSSLKASYENFFVQEIKQVRKFSFRECLTPIHINELNKNSNLKQNPGW